MRDLANLLVLVTQSCVNHLALIGGNIVVFINKAMGMENHYRFFARFNSQHHFKVNFWADKGEFKKNTGLCFFVAGRYGFCEICL